MTKSNVRQELEQRASRAILAKSFYRWESALLIAGTIVLSALTGLGMLNIGFPFWVWLVLGGVGETALVWSSLQDPEFRTKAVGEMFREKFDARGLKNKMLRSQVQKALEYRDSIDRVVNESQEGVLRDHLKDVSSGITSWMENIFRLARRLDAYAADQVLQRDRQTVQPEIDQMKKRLGTEDDGEVKRQLSQAIAQKQIQRDNLKKLEAVMEQAEIQMDRTLAAMATAYSQVKLLDSRSVNSGRAQRLQHDIVDQVQALQDVVQTMDQVYQLGTSQLGQGAIKTQP